MKNKTTILSLYLLWAFLLAWVVFSLLSRKANAELEYGLSNNGNDQHLLRDFTAYFYITQDKYQTPEWRETFKKAMALVNNILGVRAVDFGFLDWEERFCEKGNDINDLCFYTFTPVKDFNGNGNLSIISADTLNRSIGYETFFGVYVPGTKILESDISMYRQEHNYFKPRDERTTYILAHEMFHALGFSHVDKTETIMNINAPEPTEDNPIACVDWEQVKNWKKAINQRGGFYEGYGFYKMWDSDPIFFDID